MQATHDQSLYVASTNLDEWWGADCAMPMTRALLLAIVAGFAQAFVPGQVPGGRHWAKLRRSTCGGTAVAQKLPQRRGSYSLRMSEEPSDKEMEELLRKRVQLLEEKEELLQERKSIVSASSVTVPVCPS